MEQYKTLPLLATQQGIWLAEQISEQQNTYVIAHGIEINGSLNIAQLDVAICQAMSEADTVTADYKNGQQLMPVNVLPAQIARSQVLDYRQHDNAEQAAKTWMVNDINQPHSEQQSAISYRHVLFQLPNKNGQCRWLWYQRFHHLMLDGYSFITLTKRVALLYSSLMAGKSLPAVKLVSVADVLKEYDDYHQSSLYQRDQAFWQQYCETLAPPSSLSHQIITDIVPSARLLKSSSTFSLSLFGELQHLAQQHNVSIAELLMCSIAIYLYRMTGNARQAIGMPFMRRMGSVAINSSAPVVNVLPIQFNIDPKTGWAVQAKILKAELKKVRKHVRYDAEFIMRDQAIGAQGERLYGALINYKMFDYQLDFYGVEGRTKHLASGPVDDIEFDLMIDGQQVSVELRANANYYQQHELDRHCQRLQSLITSLVKQPEQPVWQVSLLDQHELAMLKDWGTGARLSQTVQQSSVIDIFFEQVAKHPDNVALVMATNQLTFSELAQRVNQLSHLLLQHGVQAKQPVAVALPRSIDAISMMLAILNIGACWLPIDPQYPQERVQHILTQAMPALMISHTGVKMATSDCRRINLDDAKLIGELKLLSAARVILATVIELDDPAYIIFTSGSTGKPKGVQIPHGGLVNLFSSHQAQIYQQQIDKIEQRHGRPMRVAHTHSMAFDSAWAHILWLLMGQELHIFDEELRRDAYAMVSKVRQDNIDALDLPPSLCSTLLANGLMAGTHVPCYITIGGEAAPTALWQQLQQWPDLVTYNLYGPTEYTVDALGASIASSVVPVIGRPIANTDAYVLDQNLQLAPMGAIGELYLSGASLARGYLGATDLTATRFVANPYQAGERMYRTGDMVRWNHQGMLEFLGRGDDQIKVRGYRVELSDVENALSLLPNVNAAAVITEAVNNSHRLHGYCAIENVDPAQIESLSRELLSALHQTLPPYMVPTSLTLLADLPRTINGKIDKKALPKPQIITQKKVPAQGIREHLLCNAMADILAVAEVGAEDDFFDLGGDSILAINFTTSLRQQGYLLPPSRVFSARTPRKIAPLLDEVAHSDSTTKLIKPLTLPAEIKALLVNKYGEFQAAAPVLPLQIGMLYLAQLGDESANYNAWTRIELQGELDRERLRRAFDVLLSLHPQLAGVFDLDTAPQPVFLLPQLHDLCWPWQFEDISECQGDELTRKHAKIEQELLNDALSTQRYTGMLQACLIKKSSQDYALFINVHHLLIDGWSTPIILRDLLTAYRDNSQVMPSKSTIYPAVLQQLVARDLSASQALWQDYLRDAKPCNLFEDLTPSAQVCEAQIMLDADMSKQLEQAIRARGLTLNLVMQGIWALALSAISGRQQVIFGMPVSGRSAAITGIEDQVGLFLNTIPIKIELQAQQSLWQQLDTIAIEHMELIDHDGLGLSEIQQLASSASLFDTLLVVENYPDSDYLGYDLDGVHITKIHNRGYSHYPLALLVIPGQRIEFLVENRGAVEQPEQLAQLIISLLRQLITEPDKKLQDYTLQTADEIALITQVNNTSQRLEQATLRSCLREQANRTPQAIAFIDAKHQLSFSQLRYQVQCLAEKLDSLGVTQGNIVAVALPRSAELSIAILAIIEVGAAYLPLDIGYPDQRLDVMLADASPSLLVTDRLGKVRFNTVTSYCFDALEEPGLQPKINQCQLTGDDAAYIIYTSGTTGRPKGVLVSHRAIVNRIQWMQAQYPLSERDVVLQKTPCSFDVSVWEFFWSYMVGAQLTMAEPEAHRDPQLLAQTIEQFSVTTLHFVPSMLAIFCHQMSSENNHSCASIRQVFCSGEALPKSLANEFSTLFSAPLHNLYGPTEAAVDVTYHPAVANISQGGAGVPIGKPVWNTQLRVLDQWLRPVALGAPGELYLCGEQLAIGYLNRADLTATRFVADPFSDGQRMYCTGDIVRWLPSGDVEYLGRSDDQLKIRGQRIELGEIETQLRQFPAIANAVVDARILNDHNNSVGDQRQLVAYYVCHVGKTVTPKILAQDLAQTLSGAMVPVAYVELAELPLSANGKLDRKALPAPNVSLKNDQVGRLPAKGLESRLANIFKRVLAIEHIYADDDFFAIGGHSLLAMTLAIEIRKDLDRTVPVGQIMITPTIEKLAIQLNLELMNNDFGSDGFDHVLPLRAGNDAPLICIYPGSGFAWQYSVLSRYLDNDMPIIGLQSPRPNGLIASSRSMAELIERQLEIIRKIQPHGPYHLLGYSLGGTIAYGVATLLQAQGEQVDFLGLLDTYPSEVHDWSNPQDAEADVGAEREQQQVLNDSIDDSDEDLQRERDMMLSQIFANYKDAVELLAQATTPKYSGDVTLFIAQKSIPEYIRPKEVWLDYTDNVDYHFLADVEHQDVMSPDSLRTLGPLINQLIENSRQGLKQSMPHAHEI